MNSARILQPILDGGIETIKFFNGRLLTGEDMQREQLAQRELRALLGRAQGHGVALGFGVEPARALSDPALAIQAGLAINREGEPVYLPKDVVLELVSTSLVGTTSSGPSGSALFRDCAAPATGLYTIGNDVWILTVAPARGPVGSAPVTGLGNSHTACNAKFEVEGVQFRLVQITGEFPAAALQTSALDRLRGVVAARCFDTAGALAELSDPFLPRASKRLVEVLYERGTIKPREVPLAVFHWAAASGFQFVDRWAVRRRVAHAHAADRWGLSDASRAEAEALVYQFQDQVDDLYTRSPENVRARERFVHMPAFGLLPVTGSGTRGFSIARFFEGFTLRPSVGTLPGGAVTSSAYTVIEASRVRALLENALHYPAIDTGTDEVFWIYQVRENAQAVSAGARVQPYVLFARGAVAYHGAANFDVSHWGYATFS